MKNTTGYILSFVVSIALTSMAYGQNRTTSGTTKDSLKKNGQEKQATSDNANIVINMAMIESFRRCYDKIEVVAWADMFRSFASDDTGTSWMAFQRMAFIPSIDSISTTNLALEKEKVRNEIENSQSLKKSIVSIPENKPDQKSKNIKNTVLLSLVR
jgi:hypothetical protein